ncbi:44047_t:CDS:2, partial [Gigaspora margarita]
LVSIIRLSIKCYKYISYKLSNKQEISQVEEEFFKSERTEAVKEAKTSPKKDLILPTSTETEPTVMAPSKKVMLELLEYGTTDYSTDEVQKQIIDQELKQTNKIKKLIENRYKEVIVKEASNFLVQNNENQMEVSFSSYNRLLEEKHRKTKAIYVQLTSKATSRVEALKKAWAIYFEKEKIVRISSGKFDSNIIQERKKFQAIIKNLSKDALKSLMLRQFKKINTKMVFIPEN